MDSRSSSASSEADKLSPVIIRNRVCRIESVPLKRLAELSGFRKRRWEFRDGWLILEAF